MKKIIFILVQLIGCLSYSSFEENSRRYLSGAEIVLSIGQFIPISTTENVASNPCIDFSTYRSAIGINSPVTGEPISSSISQATVQWISSCVYFSLPSATRFSQDKNQLQTFLGPEGFDIFVKRLRADNNKDILNVFDEDWNSWPQDQKTLLLLSMVHSILGPDAVIKDFGFTSGGPEMVTKLDLILKRKHPSSKVFEITRTVFLILVLRDEFLSY